jgi:hypothetical protein
MASVALIRRVEKVVGYPPLCDMGVDQRRDFHEALLEADTFEDPPGKWQAAIVTASRTGRSCAPYDRGLKPLSLFVQLDSRVRPPSARASASTQQRGCRTPKAPRGGHL